MEKLLALFGILLLTYNVGEAQTQNASTTTGSGDNLQQYTTSIAGLHNSIVKAVNSTLTRVKRDYDEFEAMVSTLQADAADAASTVQGALLNTVKEYGDAIQELAGSASSNPNNCSTLSTDELKQIADEYIANATSCVNTTQSETQTYYDDLNTPFDSLNASAINALDEADQCVVAFNKSQSVETAIEAISCLTNVTTDVADFMVTRYLQFRTSVTLALKGIGTALIGITECDVDSYIIDFIAGVDETYDSFRACMANDTSDATFETSTDIPGNSTEINSDTATESNTNPTTQSGINTTQANTNVIQSTTNSSTTS